MILIAKNEPRNDSLLHRTLGGAVVGGTYIWVDFSGWFVVDAGGLGLS